MTLNEIHDDVQILRRLFIKHAEAHTLHVELWDGDEYLFGGITEIFRTNEVIDENILTVFVHTEHDGPDGKFVVIYLDKPDDYEYKLEEKNGTVWVMVKVYD